MLHYMASLATLRNRALKGLAKGGINILPILPRLLFLHSFNKIKRTARAAGLTVWILLSVPSDIVQSDNFLPADTWENLLSDHSSCEEISCVSDKILKAKIWGYLLCNQITFYIPKSLEICCVIWWSLTGGEIWENMFHIPSEIWWNLVCSQNNLLTKSTFVSHFTSQISEVILIAKRILSDFGQMSARNLILAEIWERKSDTTVNTVNVNIAGHKIQQSSQARKPCQQSEGVYNRTLDAPMNYRSLQKDSGCSYELQESTKGLWMLLWTTGVYNRTLDAPMNYRSLQ